MALHGGSYDYGSELHYCWLSHCEYGSDEELLQEDLSAFHASFFHLPNPHTSSIDGSTVNFHGDGRKGGLRNDLKQQEYYDEADNGLGHYHDGVKRTLTDEQVAMFRHSEVYAILRARQVARENMDISDSEAEVDRDDLQGDEDREDVKDNDLSEEGVMSPPDSGPSPTRPTPPTEECATVYYAENSGAQIQEPERITLKRGIHPTPQENRKRKRYEGADHISHNSKIRARGRVRELDASFAEEQPLDYDDDVAPSTKGAQQEQQIEEPSRPEGKKIWWPVLSS